MTQAKRFKGGSLTAVDGGGILPSGPVCSSVRVVRPPGIPPTPKPATPAGVIAITTRGPATHNVACASWTPAQGEEGGEGTSAKPYPHVRVDSFAAENHYLAVHPDQTTHLRVPPAQAVESAWL